MSRVVAQECSGSNSPCSHPKNSVAPATNMLPRSPPSLHNLFTTTLENDFRIPPLNAQRFNGSFEHFCTVKGLVLDHEPLHMGEKEVNLHSLHSEVMGHQGYNVNEVPDFPPISHQNVALTQADFFHFIYIEKA